MCIVKRVLELGRVVPGGGAVEAALSIHLENYATTLGTREQLAIAEFADALLVIPKTLVGEPFILLFFCFWLFFLSVFLRFFKVYLKEGFGFFCFVFVFFEKGFWMWWRRGFFSLFSACFTFFFLSAVDNGVLRACVCTRDAKRGAIFFFCTCFHPYKFPFLSFY